MDHDQALAALITAKAKCSDACVDEAVHAPHRAEVEEAYANYAAASRAVGAEEAERRRIAGLPPVMPEGFVTILTNDEGASDGS